MRRRQGQARVYQVPTPSPPQERLCPPAKITHPRITRRPLPTVSSRARTSAHTGPSRSAVLPGAERSHKA